MLGQEDVGPVKKTRTRGRFPISRRLSRAAVLAAGVTFNAISAMIVIYDSVSDWYRFDGPDCRQG